MVAARESSGHTIIQQLFPLADVNRLPNISLWQEYLLDCLSLCIHMLHICHINNGIIQNSTECSSERAGHDDIVFMLKI